MNSEFIQSIIDEGLNDYSGSSFLRIKRNIAIDLIIDRAEKRGLKACFHQSKVYELSGYGKTVVFQQNAPENSVVATSITPDKALTKKILAQHQLPVPQGRTFRNYEQAARYFSACAAPQVVKPNKGATSLGVTVNVTQLAAFKKAWEHALTVGDDIVVEDYVIGDYLRVFVIGGRAAGAYACIPAYVVGDGAASIGEIIKRKNKQRARNPATMAKKNHISRTELMTANGYTLESVPAAGQKIALTAVVNIGAGGESIEVVDRVHPSLLDLAEQAVGAIPGLHVAGVDMIVADFTKAALPQNAVILEINWNPALDDHVFPMYGKPVDIPNVMLDYVLRDDRIGRKLSAYEFPEYIPSCGGTAFSRNYDVQMEVIKQAAHRHNLRVMDISSLIYTLSSDLRSVGFNQGMSDRTTSVSRMASNRKDWTKRLLAEAGITTPRGESFSVEQRELAWQFAEKMARPFVVKPRSGSGGRGVSVNISTRGHFELAWNFAVKSKPTTILIEEFFRGNDFRLFVVGDQVSAASQRVPAHIVGNGVNTVQELIDAKNKLRSANPYLGAKPIKITSMIEFNLHQIGITASTILDNGQYLQLHSVANIGSGGESRDVSELMHPEFAGIAVRARQAVLGAPYAGIDLLAEDIAKAPHEQRWMVIEVNTNPDVALHHFPHEGPARDAASAILRHLFPEIASGKPPLEKTVRVVIRGQVQGVGYCNWLWRKAHLHALSGWVRSTADGSVEAALRGTPNAIEHMTLLCKAGTRGSVVDELTVLPFDGILETGFFIHPTARLGPSVQDARHRPAHE